MSRSRAPTSCEEAIAPRDLGRKALAINLSDIASAGAGRVSPWSRSGLPRGLEAEFVDGLYRGLREEAELFGVDIVGGNITQHAAGSLRRHLHARRG